MNDPICLSLAVVLCVFFMGWLDRFIRREKQRAQLRKRLQHNANKGSTNLGAITVAGLLLLVVLPQPAQTQEEISRRTDSAEKATRVDTVGLQQQILALQAVIARLDQRAQELEKASRAASDANSRSEAAEPGACALSEQYPISASTASGQTSSALGTAKQSRLGFLEGATFNLTPS